MKFSHLVKAPKNYDRLPRPWLFLAGGITGCPDWQALAVEKLMLRNQNGGTILNPRRDQFNIGDTKVAEEQIHWEFKALRDADAIIFWFPKDQIQPIALYELGAWSPATKPVFVGVEAGYAREFDIRIQMMLVRPEIVVHSSLDDLCHEIITLDDARWNY